MAHRVVNLILVAEEASPDTKEETERAATDLILRIWEHRAGARFYRQPLQAYDDLFDALIRLQSRRFGGRRRVDDDDPILSLTTDIEDLSKDLVVAALAPRAREAADVEHIWEASSEFLPEDEQRRAINAIWKLIRDVTSEHIADAPGDGDEQTGPHSTIGPLTPAGEERALLRTLSRTMLEKLGSLQSLVNKLDDSASEPT